MKISFTKVFLNKRVDEERKVGRRKSRVSTLKYIIISLEWLGSSILTKALLRTDGSEVGEQSLKKGPV